MRGGTTVLIGLAVLAAAAASGQTEAGANPAPKVTPGEAVITTHTSEAHGVTRALLAIPPIQLLRWESIISDGQFALAAVRIKSSQPGVVVNVSYAGLWGPLEKVFSVTRAFVSGLRQQPSQVAWLGNGTTIESDVPFDVSIEQFNELSVIILGAALLVWIIAPYIASEALFSATVFVLGIFIVLGTVAFFFASRVFTQGGAVTASVGALFTAVDSTTNGLVSSFFTMAFERALEAGLGRHVTADEVGNAAVGFALVMAVAVGIYHVLYIPPTETNLRSFSNIIRFATIAVAATAGSTPEAMVLCAAAPLLLQLVGSVASIFVVLDGIARRIAAGVVYAVYVLCCPCRTIGRYCCCCCCGGSRVPRRDDDDAGSEPDVDSPRPRRDAFEESPSQQPAARAGRQTPGRSSSNARRRRPTAHGAAREATVSSRQELERLRRDYRDASLDGTLPAGLSDRARAELARFHSSGRAPYGVAPTRDLEGDWDISEEEMMASAREEADEGEATLRSLGIDPSDHASAIQRMRSNVWGSQ